MSNIEQNSMPNNSQLGTTAGVLAPWSSANSLPARRWFCRGLYRPRAVWAFGSRNLAKYLVKCVC